MPRQRGPATLVEPGCHPGLLRREAEHPFAGGAPAARRSYEYQGWGEPAG